MRRGTGNKSGGISPLFLLVTLLSYFFSLSQAQSLSIVADATAVRQTELSTPSTATISDSTVRPSDATQTEDELILKARAVLQRRNKARTARPAVNKYEFANTDELIANATLAASLPLDGSDVTANATAGMRLMGDTNITEDVASSYSIPEELAKAAARIAEAIPQVPKGNHSEVARKTLEKYRHRKVNDTNVAPQQQRPYGRLGSFGVGQGFSQLHSNSMAVLSDDMSVTAETWWMAQQQQLGSAPFAPASNYKVWRNVMDYGAKGDGKTDDTAAINRAISDSQRCGPECGTSTVVPAVVYFPSGTYLVSSPIIQYYNTQFLGDPNSLPTILAASSFVGLGVITSSPYVSDNEGWYLNTANFLRSIRNFKIDIRLTDPSSYICGIHWQVSQATSLENIEFYMLFNSDVPGNTQQVKQSA
ncbi:hypothetical protein KVR01_009035 [Diaporthe batatas]|uniref:uncharacterized protein n=1 Tax=Diaporthe batatas TaxID=748121 RepID=UPI001D04E251|nr:uncharacterized protein KVR01_009035 [Diaporthe batatas]KAG8160771.1 hypothetical protein KVR01_009035 [Diaporthe batatas]